MHRKFKFGSDLGSYPDPIFAHIYIDTHNLCIFGYYIPSQFKAYAENICFCIKPSHQNV